MIHAIGPIWRGGTAGESQLLRSAYAASLRLAAEYGCRSIALPALSTGAYGYPLDQASRVALGAAAVALAGDSSIEIVRFVLFSSSAYAVFAAALVELQSELAAE